MVAKFANDHDDDDDDMMSCNQQLNVHHNLICWFPHPSPSPFFVPVNNLIRVFTDLALHFIHYQEII